MPAISNLTAEQKGKFNDMNGRTYAEQGRFFLNAFWSELSGSAQEVYNACNTFVALDLENGSDGSCLETPDAHTAFERLHEPMTAVELRALLKEIDIKIDNKLSLLEYLLYAYRSTPNVNLVNLMTRRQGDNRALYDAEAEMKQILAKQAARQSRLDGLRAQSVSEELSFVKRNQIKHELDMELLVPETEIPMAIQRCQVRITKAAKNGDGTLASTQFWLQAQIREDEKFQKTFVNTNI